MPARKPSVVLELTGTFDHNPARRRARASEPQPDGPLGEPPDHLAPTVAACWSEIAELACAGVLARSDRLIVEHAAYLLADLRAKQWRVPPAVLLRYECTLARLGLSPADRARVSEAPPQRPKNASNGFEF